MDIPFEALRAEISQEQWRYIRDSGCCLVRDWYGEAQLSQILSLFAAAIRASPRFAILDAGHVAVAVPSRPAS